MELKYKSYTLQLKQTFTTSHGSVDQRESVIVNFSDHNHVGYGECVAIQYYDKSINQFEESLSEIAGLLPRQKNSLDQMTEFIEEAVQDSFIQCALDIALHDFFAKKSKASIRKALGLPFNCSTCSTLTIGITSVEETKRFVQSNPWPIYKVKLGTSSDVEVIEAIRSLTDAPLVVDANSGWDLEKTIEMSRWLKGQNVLYIEQPINASDKDAIANLTGKSSLPILADESCHGENDLPFCFEHFDGINIKLMKCGGITTAIRMLEKARINNKATMIGCMTESSIGISAGAQLISLFDFVDLDGALMLANDPADGVKLHNGFFSYPDRFGHGAILI